MTISEDDALAHYLKIYSNKRLLLLSGNSRDYFFVSYKGATFASSGSFSKYIGYLFEREVAVKAGTTALRHAVLTYFNSLDESNDQRLRKFGYFDETYREIPKDCLRRPL